MNVKTKTIIYKKGSTGSKFIESIVKDGSNYIKKYVIMGCESEKVKTNTSGHYIFNGNSFTKFERSTK